MVEWTLAHFPESTVGLARFFSQLGNEHFYLLVLPLLFWLGPWTTGLTAARSVILADLLGEWLKWTLKWPRPPLSWRLAEESSPGFVSTHAALSMALAVSVWRQWPRARPLLVLWVLGVGWSRIRLGVHYPLDLVGGWALGLLVALALLRMRVDSRRTLYLVVGLALIMMVLWPVEGAASWQRDLGLLLGAELGVAYVLSGWNGCPERLGMAATLGRLLLLVAAYVGLKTLGWPRLLRYFVLGVLVSFRRPTRAGTSPGPGQPAD